MKMVTPDPPQAVSEPSTIQIPGVPQLPERRDPIAGRIPFFYGWIMLPVVMLANICTSPGQTFGIAMFNIPLRESLGLSHTQLSGAYMLGTLLACFPMPLVGALMDRHGIRRTMCGVVLCLAAACLLMSRVSGIVSLFFAFLLLRMFGQGALTLLTGNTLPMWFHNRLGRVSGFNGLAFAGAIFVVPGVLNYSNGLFGWRWTYAMMGVVVCAVMLPILAIFFRNRPADVGQLVDGETDRESGVANATNGAQQKDDRLPQSERQVVVHFTLGEAVRTRAYWILLATFSSWGMIATAVIFHLPPLLVSRGLAEGLATDLLKTFAMAMAVMNLCGGFLADRWPLRRLVNFGVAGMTIGTILLWRVDSEMSAHWYAVVFGASQGVLAATGATIWPRYFGRVHLGKIRGTITTATIAATSAGPLIVGFLLDQTGSYTPSLLLFIGQLIVLWVATLFATPPEKPVVP